MGSSETNNRARLGRGLLLLQCFASLLAIGASTGRADTTFVLQPGATITPTFGGSSEPLAGSFTWHDFGAVTTTIEGFNAVALNFTSPSYTLVLDTTAANEYGSDTFADGTTYFGEVFDVTGLSPSVLFGSSFTSGQFVGDYHNPTQVTYTNIKLAPLSGGAFMATLNFTATAIPEPVSTSAVAAGLLLLSARNRRPRRSFLKSLLRTNYCAPQREGYALPA